MQWTPAQDAAIFGRAKNLLVSAAAGSGKTAVLVERVFVRLADPTDPADITDFLIVTFTNAAASEMRARLCKRIAEALAADPQNRHLRRQMQLVHEAQITTVHAFCLSLIRDHFHALSLRPDFRLPGENEAELLLDEAAETLLGEQYEARTEAFDALTAALSDDKSDKRLKELLIRAHTWFESEADGEGYIARCNAISTAAIAADPVETVWGRQHLRRLRSDAAYFVQVYDRMLAAAARGEKAEKVVEVLGEERALIAAIESAAAEGDWSATACAVAAYGENKRTLRFPKAFPPDLAEEIKAARETVKKKWKEKLANDIIGEPIADTKAVNIEADGLQREFFRLVLRLDEIFTEMKREANLLDFADLEQLAVKLLAKKDENGEFVPTELALEKSRTLREIMVDEYQDTNGLQDMIFRMLASHSSLFTVGDVKQSIYRFRRADPLIFLRRKNAYPLGTPLHQGKPFVFAEPDAAILLSDNFRSRREVLDSVNAIFRPLCSEEFGELDYTEDEALHCGRQHDEANANVTELAILNLPDGAHTDDEEDDTAESLSGAEYEAAYIAARIRQMIDQGFLVETKDKGKRPCTEGDFAILHRSPKKRAAGLARALRAQGLAVSADKSESFFATDEITAMLALLHTVDNPGSDLDLIGCLASPLFGFSYDTLANIRAANGRRGMFYDSLVAAAAADEASDMREAAASFLRRLEEMRRTVADLSVSAAVTCLIEATSALVVYAATEGGSGRCDNILRLVSLAQSYDQIGDFGDFVRYLDRLEEADDLSRKTTVDSSDTVKIMSIHASKGLEFPIVFLSGLSEPINSRWKSEAVALHPTMGLGFYNRSRCYGGVMTTLRKEAITEVMAEEQLSEELRILYVAMTRAREKLICVARHKNAGKLLRELESGRPPCLSVYCRMHPSFAAWIEAVVMTDPNAPFVVDRVDALLPTETDGAGETVVEAADEATANEIRDRLAYRYPHASAASLPAKLTATLYKRLLAEEEAAHAVAEIRPTRHAHFEKPKFTEAHRTLSPTERGTATHLAMQLLPLRAYETENEVAAELENLHRRGSLTAQETEAIRPGALLTFYQTSVGRTITALPKERVWREFKFSLLTPATKYFPENGGDETLLLQGVADLFYETDAGELVVVDFKTDNVTPATSPMRAQAYAPQLAIYADALSEITGKRVAEKYLWFFATGELIKV